MSASRSRVAQRLLALARAAQQQQGGSGAPGGSSAAARAAAWAATAVPAAATTATTAAAARAFFSHQPAAASTALARSLLPRAARPPMMMMMMQPSPRRPAHLASLHTSRRTAAAAAAAEEAAEQQKQTPWGQKSPLSFNSMVAGLAVFLGLVAFAQGTADKRVGDMMQKSQQVAGKAAVGGPFRLIDTRGKAFTNRDLLGEFALLYFGFTHCPDICPDELEKVAEAVDAVERTTGAKVVPVFISVDPRRDTPARVAAYVKEFHPRMLGLTGSEQAVTDAAKAYRVYFSRTDGGGGGEGEAGGGGGSDDDYLVDHSIITYLVDPKGEFVTFYSKAFDARQLAESIAGHVMAWAGEDEAYLSRLACKLPPAAKEEEEEGGAASEAKAK